MVFFFNDTATTEIYTLSLHDALPIFPINRTRVVARSAGVEHRGNARGRPVLPRVGAPGEQLGEGQGRRAERDRVRSHLAQLRSEEHTSELQSRQYLVCRLLLEKKTYS